MKIDKVNFITLDLYKPYYKLMNKLFHNATLIPDRFHIVLQSQNAIDNKDRQKFMDIIHYASNLTFKKLLKLNFLKYVKILC